MQFNCLHFSIYNSMFSTHRDTWFILVFKKMLFSTWLSVAQQQPDNLPGSHFSSLVLRAPARTAWNDSQYVILLPRNTHLAMPETARHFYWLFDVGGALSRDDSQRAGRTWSSSAPDGLMHWGGYEWPDLGKLSLSLHACPWKSKATVLIKEPFPQALMISQK